MLMGSSTDVYSGLSQVSTGAFNDVKVAVIIIAGIVLGFYILERLITAIFPHKYYGDNSQKDV
jgi:hypothetical protein